MYKEIEEHYVSFRNILVKKLSGKLGGTAQAEDAVQSAYTRATEYFGSWDRSLPFDNWFSTILTNSIADFKREERNHGAHVELESTGNDLLAPGPDPFLQRVASEVERDIGAERPEDRYILRLYFLQQYAPRDISKLVARSDGAIRQVIFRFRDKMRERYA